MRQFISNGSGFSGAIFMAAILLGTGYFTFAALDGDFGKFHQMQLLAQKKTLQTELLGAQRERQVVENRVRRLSDDYLDLDLLDERARKVLGLMRADEIVIQ